MSLQEKKQVHTRFWQGQGPCLILIPTAEMEGYDLENYRQRFANPALMWEAEMKRALPAVDWPTDGIPTVRPNLGVVFVPSLAGQSYIIQPEQMPWPGEPLSRQRIRAIPERDIATAELMGYAAEFYAVHKARGGDEIAPYLPDTQGVFDVAHLLDGEQIFYELIEDRVWVRELLEICNDLYRRASLHLKALLGEPAHEMIHGHGTAQGVYFPHAGVRMSEDTPTLLSPTMIEEFVLPFIERAAAPFGGVFVHYCGYHTSFFEQLCRSQAVRAIDLGNSERYDARWLCERSAQSSTVLYSRIAARPGEDWQSYVRRLVGLIKETGARCILRPMVFPQHRDECLDMLQLWHELTT